MPAFEEICSRIFKTHNVWQKLAIGGVLSFIPIVNFFALGYIYRYLEQLQSRADFVLPEWDRWDQLFYNGIRMVVVGLLFFIFPVLLLKLFIFIMGIITTEVASVIGWTIMALVLFVLPAVFCCALYQFQRFGRWQIFLDFPKWLPMLRLCSVYFVLPTFFLWGLWILCLPLYGFAVFIGLVLFLAYGMVVFSFIEKSS